MKRFQSKTHRYHSPESLPRIQSSHLVASSAPRSVQERVVVLVDALSLYYGALQLRINIDHGRLLQYLSRDSRLVHALFYTGIDLLERLRPEPSPSQPPSQPPSQTPSQRRPRAEPNENQRFLHWLRQQGYRVVTKTVQRFPDGSQKLDLDVEIAIDMMKLAGSCDRMVLVSGDDTLAYAVRRVSDRGIRSQVVSLRDITSERLLDAADDYCDLYTIREQIQLQ